MVLSKEYRKKLKDINRKIVIIFYIFSLIFVIIFTIIPIVQADIKTSQFTDDYDYTFQNRNYVEYTNPNISDYVNIANHTTQYSGLYNATNSFENETVGTLPNKWIDASTGNAIVQVNNSDATHSHILELFSTPIGNARVEKRFAPIFDVSIETVELWFKTNDSWSQSYIVFFESAVQKLTFRCVGNTFQWHDGSWQILDTIPKNNTWIHIRFDFDVDLDQADIYINGYDEGTYAFSNTALWLNVLVFVSDHATYYYSWFDAIGWSHYDYDVNDNIIPEPESYIDVFQIASHSFDYYPNGSVVQTDTSIYNGNWTEIDSANYIHNYQTLGNGFIQFTPTTTESHFYKNNFNISTDYNRIWFWLWIYDLNDGSYFDIEFYSSDNTKIIHLRFLDQASIRYLQYYDGSSFKNLLTNLGYGTPLRINFDMFIQESTVFIQVYQTVSPFYQWVHFPKIDVEKDGIHKVNFIAKMFDASPVLNYYLEYFVLQNNGTSITNDFYSLDYSIAPAEYYYLYKHQSNYMEYNITGLGTFTLYSDPFEVKVFPIESYNNFSSELRTVNLLQFRFTDGQDTISERLQSGNVLITSNQTVFPVLNYIRLYGITLNLNATWYFTPYYQNSTLMDWTESYFYVDTSNRLQYLLTTNNSDLEYIQIEFDTNDVDTTNYSVSIALKKSRSDLFSEFRLYFTDLTYYYTTALVNYRTEHTILTEGKLTDKFTFLITDDDNNVNNTLSGYYYNPKLIYYTDIGITISLLNFFEIVPIIAMVFLLPIVIGSKSRLRFLIIPLVMVMSIISYISDLIPLWLTVVINLFCILYYFIKNKYSD